MITWKKWLALPDQLKKGDFVVPSISYLLPDYQNLIELIYVNAIKQFTPGEEEFHAFTKITVRSNSDLTVHCAVGEIGGRGPRIFGDQRIKKAFESANEAQKQIKKRIESVPSLDEIAQCFDGASWDQVSTTRRGSAMTDDRFGDK